MAVPHGIDRSGAAGGSGTQGMSGFLNDLADPGADRIVFWDDSDGDLDWLSLGTGLSITGTSLNLSSNLQNVSSLTPTDGGVIIGDGNSFVVESGATARASLGIVNPVTPDAVGDFVVGETASNAISVPLPMGGSPMVNGQVSLSVSGSALIITMLGADGTSLSASNALFARMPQGNPLDGTVAVRKHTSTLTMTVSHGSTLGTANGATTPLYVYLLDNSGTLEFAISGTYAGPQSVRSTTAEGGAGGADTLATIYSTAARTSVPIVPILKWDCTQTSAGVWLSIVGEKAVAPFLANATNAETLTGTDTIKPITPAGLNSVLGLVKLNSGTVSNAATLDIAMTSYTAYKNKLFVFQSFIPASNNVQLYFRTSTDGGSTFAAASSNYKYSSVRVIEAGTVTGAGSVGDTEIELTSASMINNAGYGASGSITLYDTTNAAMRPRIMWDMTYHHSSEGWTRISGMGSRENAEDTDAFRILFSGDNIASGTWTLYGMS